LVLWRKDSSMSDIMKTPKYLLGHANEIRGLLAKQEPIKYNYDIVRSLKEDERTSGDINVLDDRFHGAITRKDIVELVQDSSLANTGSLRQIFLACMLWGWGKDRSGRGRKNIRKSMLDPATDNVLKEAFNGIKNKVSVKEIYDSFKIDGCGPSFMTKFFYFLGKGFGVRCLPLILDSRVANFLEYLCQQENIKIERFVRINSRAGDGKIKTLSNYSEGYEKYVITLNTWAEELQCEPDDIEYFMFKNSEKIAVHIVERYFDESMPIMVNAIPEKMQHREVTQNMVNQLSLEEFTRRLAEKVGQCYPYQRRYKDGEPQEFWCLNLNKENQQRDLNQFARLTFLKKEGKFKIKTLGNIVDQGHLKYGELSETDRWNRNYPGLIYRIKPGSKGPDYEELLFILKEIRKRRQ